MDIYRETPTKGPQQLAQIFFIIAVALTALAFYFSKKTVNNQIIDRFDFRAREITASIEDRMNIYEQTLWSGVALFYANEKPVVSREEFANFVEVLDLKNKWPGIQGIGFAIPVSPEDKKKHEKTIRQQGFMEYKIRPEGIRNEYSSIIYLEPFDWRNKRAFGYDMWSNEMRQNAMKRARDENKAATSGMITLVQETAQDAQKGFLTYVPVYSKFKPSSIEDRRNSFLGWIYAPFRVNDLMEGILQTSDEKLAFQIYDGLSVNDNTLLYASSPLSEFKFSTNTTELDPRHHKIVNIKLQGRPWQLVFENKAFLNPHLEYYVPYIIVITGTIINLFLLYLLYSFQQITSKAKHIAEQMNTELIQIKNSLETQVCERTKALESAKEDLNLKVKERTLSLQKNIEELKDLQKLTTGREMRVIELKKEVNELSLKLGEPAVYTIQDTTQ